MITASAARELITPDLEAAVELGGYGKGTVASEVRDQLECSVVLLSSAERRLLMLSVDTLYVPTGLREAVESEAAAYGLGPEDVLTAASHTHYAPAVDVQKPALGRVSPVYLERVQDRVLSTVRKVFASDAAPVTISVAEGNLDGLVVSRRRRPGFSVLSGGDRVVMGPNRSSRPVADIGLMALSMEGRPIAFLCYAPCHPTSLPESDQVSAHYPGVVRADLRCHFGQPDLPVLFLQGFSGDLRPPAYGFASKRRPWRWSRFGNFTESAYRKWVSQLSRRFLDLVPEMEKIDGEIGISARASRPADLFARGASARGEVTFQSVTIGNIRLVGASAELVAAYSPLVASIARSERTWMIGCLDTVIGYWPTREMLREGGYEVVGHCNLFGLTSLTSNVEEEVLDGFRRVCG